MNRRLSYLIITRYSSVGRGDNEWQLQEILPVAILLPLDHLSAVTLCKITKKKMFGSTIPTPFKYGTAVSQFFQSQWERRNQCPTDRNNDDEIKKEIDENYGNVCQQTRDWIFQDMKKKASVSKKDEEFDLSLLSLLDDDIKFEIIEFIPTYSKWSDFRKEEEYLQNIEYPYKIDRPFHLSHRVDPSLVSFHKMRILCKRFNRVMMTKIMNVKQLFVEDMNEIHFSHMATLLRMQRIYKENNCKLPTDSIYLYYDAKLLFEEVPTKPKTSRFGASTPFTSTVSDSNDLPFKFGAPETLDTSASFKIDKSLNFPSVSGFGSDSITMDSINTNSITSATTAASVSSDLPVKFGVPETLDTSTALKIDKSLNFPSSSGFGSDSARVEFTESVNVPFCAPETLDTNTVEINSSLNFPASSGFGSDSVTIDSINSVPPDVTQEYDLSFLSARPTSCTSFFAQYYGFVQPDTIISDLFSYSGRFEALDLTSFIGRNTTIERLILFKEGDYNQSLLNCCASLKYLIVSGNLRSLDIVNLESIEEVIITARCYVNSTTAKVTYYTDTNFFGANMTLEENLEIRSAIEKMGKAHATKFYQEFGRTGGMFGASDTSIIHFILKYTSETNLEAAKSFIDYLFQINYPVEVGFIQQIQHLSPAAQAIFQYLIYRTNEYQDGRLTKISSSMESLTNSMAILFGWHFWKQSQELIHILAADKSLLPLTLTMLKDRLCSDMVYSALVYQLAKSFNVGQMLGGLFIHSPNAVCQAVTRNVSCSLGKLSIPLLGLLLLGKTNVSSPYILGRIVDGMSAENLNSITTTNTGDNVLHIYLNTPTNADPSLIIKLLQKFPHLLHDKNNIDQSPYQMLQELDGYLLDMILNESGIPVEHPFKGIVQ